MEPVRSFKYKVMCYVNRGSFDLFHLYDFYIFLFPMVLAKASGSVLSNNGNSGCVCFSPDFRGCFVSSHLEQC